MGAVAAGEQSELQRHVHSNAKPLVSLPFPANPKVHVVMYYYFYLTARGISPAWKRHITLLQIVQFVSR